MNNTFLSCSSCRSPLPCGPSAPACCRAAFVPAIAQCGDCGHEWLPDALKSAILSSGVKCPVCEGAEKTASAVRATGLTHGG